MPAVGPIKLATLGVWAGGHQKDGAGYARHARPQSAQNLDIGICRRLVLSPECNFVAQHRREGVSTSCAERRGANLDNHTIGQRDRFGVFIKDHSREQRDPFSKPETNLKMLRACDRFAASTAIVASSPAARCGT